jgi:hypothetical protein
MPGAKGSTLKKDKVQLGMDASSAQGCLLGRPVARLPVMSRERTVSTFGSRTVASASGEAKECFLNPRNACNA